MCVFNYVNIYLYILECMQIIFGVKVCVCACVRIWVHEVCICKDVSVCVCVCVCLCACMQVFIMRMYVRACLHVHFRVDLIICLSAVKFFLKFETCFQFMEQIVTTTIFYCYYNIFMLQT